MTEHYQLVETMLQQPMGNGDVVCNLCLWRCRLRHGQRGFCQAHVNRNGTLYNLSYGIISAIDEQRYLLKSAKGRKKRTMGTGLTSNRGSPRVSQVILFGSNPFVGFYGG
jgi:hypothetical protein